MNILCVEITVNFVCYIMKSILSIEISSDKGKDIKFLDFITIRKKGRRFLLLDGMILTMVNNITIETEINL